MQRLEASNDVPEDNNDGDQSSSWQLLVSPSPPFELEQDDNTMRIESFSRKCFKEFFRENITKADYFHYCTLAWMVQLEATPLQIYKAIATCLQQCCGSNDQIASWILPKDAQLDLSTSSSSLGIPLEDGDDDERLRCMSCLVQFWKRFYERCESSGNTKNSRPTKRQRTGYFYSKHSSSGSDVMQGRYKVPTAFLVSWIVKECYSIECWKTLHDKVHALFKGFKTFTGDDVHAGLAILGLYYMHQGVEMEGLTPPLMLQYYLARSGGSILSLLKETTKLDYYPLRAFICDHFLKWFCRKELTMPEDLGTASIQACNELIGKDNPFSYLTDLSSSSKTSTNNSEQESEQPPQYSLGYPLMTHIEVWLLQDDIWRVADLVRRIEGNDFIDGDDKDDAWLHIWHYLLRKSKVFLDGNNQNEGYAQRRELIYNGIVSGMSYYGRESMQDFYQTLANQVWRHPTTTYAEKAYVVKACQDTVLRILFKCQGLGSETVQDFLDSSQDWPVDLSTNGMADLEQWAAQFLMQRNPIPESLLDEDDDQTLDLMSLLEQQQQQKQQKAEPSSTVVEIVEEEEEMPMTEPSSKPTTAVEAEVDDVIELADSDEDEEQQLVMAYSDDEAQPEETSEDLIEEEDEDVVVLDSSDSEDDEQPEAGTVSIMEEEDEEEEDDIGVYSDDSNSEQPEAAIGDILEEEEDDEVDAVDSDATDDAEQDEARSDDYEFPELPGTESGEVDIEGSEEEEDEIVMEDDEEKEIVLYDDDEEEEVEPEEQEEDVIVEEVDQAGEVDFPEDRDQDDEPEQEMVYADEQQEPRDDMAETLDAPSSAEPLDIAGLYGDLIESKDEAAAGEDKVERTDAAEAIAALQGFESARQSHDVTGSQEESGLDMQAPDDEEASVGQQPGEMGAPERIQTGRSEVPLDLEDSSPEKSAPATEASELNVEAPSDAEQPETMEDDDDHHSTEGKASRDDGNVASDATDDEQEFVQEVEKAETKVAAVGGGFGDTTEEEDEEGVESGKANRAAQADRRADALRVESGFASQLEEGYEPEDTHGYTEEEVSEAIHTEDEEEEWRQAQTSRAVDVEETPQTVEPQNNVPPVPHSNAHSSDDMADADEHTDPEEDLGVESSELEETTEGPPQPLEFVAYSPSSEYDRDPTTLLEYAQSAQRRHSYQSRMVNLTKQVQPVPQNTDEEMAGVESEGKPQVAEPSVDKSVGFVDPATDNVKKPAGILPDSPEEAKSRESEDPNESDAAHDFAVAATESEAADNAEEDDRAPVQEEIENQEETATESAVLYTEQKASENEGVDSADAEMKDAVLELAENEDLPKEGDVDAGQAENADAEMKDDGLESSENEGFPEEDDAETAMPHAPSDVVDEQSQPEDEKDESEMAVESADVEQEQGGDEDIVDSVEPESKEVEMAQGDSEAIETVDPTESSNSPVGAEPDDKVDVSETEAPEQPPEEPYVMEVESQETPASPKSETKVASPASKKSSTPTSEVGTVRKSNRGRKPKKHFDVEGLSDKEEKELGKKPSKIAESEDEDDDGSHAHRESDTESAVSSVPSSRRRSARRKKNDEPEAPSTRRYTPKKKAGDDDSVASDPPTRRSRRGRKQDSDNESEADAEDDQESVVSEVSKTRGSTRGKKKQAEESPASVVSTRAASRRRKPDDESEGQDSDNESKANAEDDQESVVSEVSKTRGSTRGKKKQAKESPASAVSTRAASRRRKPDDESEGQAPDETDSVMSKSATNKARKSTRRGKKTDDVDESEAQTENDEESVASSTRQTRRSTRRKKDEDDEDELVGSRASRTRPSGRKSKQTGDDESIVSTRSRRSTRSTRVEKDADDDSVDESIVSTSSRRSTRVEKDADDDSVASGPPPKRVRRQKAKKKEDETEDKPKKRSPGRPKKAAGRPPLPPPTRASTRTRKKKNLD